MLRRRVKEGFSFYALPEAEVLAIWDRLWRDSPYGDVLFAALEYYAPRVRKRVGPEFWPVVRNWPERVDNWCHCDGLSSLYSWILAAEPEAVYPQLEAWNRSTNQWLRRISLVSLIHYSGKNAVFMPLERVLPLVTACLTDEREYVQNAVGWVLREMGQPYPREIAAYLGEHGSTMSAAASRRATERRLARLARRVALGDSRDRSPRGTSCTPALADGGAAAHAPQQPRSRRRGTSRGARRLRRLRARSPLARGAQGDRPDAAAARDDETLLVQSGKPVGVFRTHEGAPRVLIANSLLVPRWATWDEFRRLEAEGLTMFGQMTAGSWIYIGTQGILQGTYQTFAAAGEKHFGSADLTGRTILTAGLGAWAARSRSRRP